ncbi:hypothetical protein QBC46DRAFT_438008 [Diplogelasinospora grovesii]|uniref:Uncharacterized protein n=1 Tax=Diplogelasinospora grovesii TaxID=303347 RepID=A0AAN6S355_9PEZI|nr:hypothetical protein QBC46DRAFT_438008 [Diplogelasinospora grovesii]
MSPGAIVGIVLGSIAAILLLYLITRSFGNHNKNRNAPPPDRCGSYYDDDDYDYSPPRRRYSHSHSYHSRWHSSTSRPVVVEEKTSVRRPSAAYVCNSDRSGFRRGRSGSRSGLCIQAHHTRPSVHLS